MQSKFRLFIDESGHHGPAAATDVVGVRYLGIAGVGFASLDDYRAFDRGLNEFKAVHFPQFTAGLPILHREEIVRTTGPFRCLSEASRRATFDNDLLDLLSRTDFTLFSVVIDKYSHGKASYRRLVHPYHYCLHALLERYCGFLSLAGLRGDVAAESRGRREDLALADAYRQVFGNGTSYLSPTLAQRTLTSGRLTFFRKTDNVAGLQLADLLAHTVTRDVLSAYGRIPSVMGAFANRLLEVVRAKYNRQVYSGKIQGYGRVILS